MTQEKATEIGKRLSNLAAEARTLAHNMEEAAPDLVTSFRAVALAIDVHETADRLRFLAEDWKDCQP